MEQKLDIQTMIFKLEQFWASKGCMIMPSYDENKGAGTMSHTPSCGQSGLNLGRPATLSLPAGQLTGATETTRTGSSSTTSSKSF